MNKPKIEICCGSLTEVENAGRFPIDRIELCSALEVGGLTPSQAIISKSVEMGLEVHVLIRPRPGGFEYSVLELEQMLQEIKDSKLAGAKGVVIGALKNGDADVVSVEQMFYFAKSLNLEVTFHRAFDFVHAQADALDWLIRMGFDRVLTSGGGDTAFEGVKQLESLLYQANGRIQIMAGGGIGVSNVLQIASSGVDAVHFSARKVLANLDKSMGAEILPDEMKIQEVLRLLGK